MYINFICPPIPYVIVGGISIFRKGDKHERRAIHNTFDLIYVRSGTMYMEEEEKHFDVREGQFLILSPDKIHASYRHCDKDTVFSWIHFYSTGDFFFSETPTSYMQTKMNKNKYYQKDQFFISFPQHGTLDSKYHKELEGYLDQVSRVKIDKYNQQKSFYDSVSSEINYQILFMKIITLICEASKEPQEKDLAEEIYSFLKNSYSEPFILTELAHRYAFHPAYITRCIKKKYGQTPLQLLISIRMDEAKKLLRTTKLHVNIIAQNVGYHDSAYFSKQFKNVTGVTAIEYRKKKGTISE